MLDQDELLDLAESIKAEGLHHPIVLDRDGMLIDGRNRLAACKIAGVEPRFTTDDSDPLRLIVSYNVIRRHVSKGQQAMITAMACSFSGHSLRTLAKHHGLSRSRLSAANVVLQHAPDLAERVRVGTLGLDAAHTAALERKAHIEASTAQHEHLRRHAPDLAEQVIEGRLSLDEARLRQVVRDTDTIRAADGDTAPALTQLADRGEITWGQAAQRAEEHRAHRHEAVLRAQQALQLIAENWTAVHDLTTRPGTPYAQEIINGLTPEARALITQLTTRS
ncbi:MULTISPECIES: ParB N-terminal domain-containing protein [unclassified Streptomyces]|uniref:ParB/RepB/Spo0J family partition protein n=1 Tax=unclassified Streptomyces TaxID=2593676 RepID=UPI00225B6790|nr:MULTISPECIES: ParB N-terminal domain-containing protein [unclassified Streptomyces]MCX5123696.1 ParB N-terminal domain-containing protein [Streptomyces sp. NBC_00347]MCX5405757.1 ParB N-terminal domain-containing protein [Streptomyces sp. NBC_00086]